MARTPKPRVTAAETPKKVTKERSLRIRVSQMQKDIFETAAARQGLTTSSWIVSRCLAAARQEEREAGPGGGKLPGGTS